MHAPTIAGRHGVVKTGAGRDHLQFVLRARAEVHPFYVACGFRHAEDMLRRDRIG
jgi:hypothetical protein